MTDTTTLKDMERLRKVSARLLQIDTEEAPDYQMLNEEMLLLSEAKFSVFNVYEADGTHFRTMAIAGDHGILDMINSYFEEPILDKRWSHDLIREERTLGRSITRFETLSLLVNDILPSPVVEEVAAIAGIGETVLIRIEKDQVMLGDFTLFMAKDKLFQKDTVADMFATMVGLVLTRLQTQQSLQESRERLLERETMYRALFEKSPLGIAYHKLEHDDNGSPVDSVFLEWNQSFQKFIGRNPAGLRMSDVCGERKADFFQWIRQLEHQEHAYDCEFRTFVVRDDRWYDCLAFLLRPGTFISMMIDVTEQKHTELMLTHSRELMKYIIEHDHNAIAVYDRDMNYIYVSQSFLRENRIDGKDIIGKNHYEVFSDIPQHWKDIHQKCIAGAVFSAEEDEFIRTDGSKEYVRWECRPWQEADGAIGGIVLYTEIITDRVKARHVLRESEEKYRLIAENASDVIWVLNLDSRRFTYMSPSIFNLRGYSPEEVMNAPIEHSFTPSSMEVAVKTIEKGVLEYISNPTKEVVVREEFQQPCKDGSVIWVESSGKFRRNSKGEIELVGVTFNIDARKRAEEKILYLSYHDSLTGLYNRRYYEAELRRLDTKRNLPITLIMIDANGLKLVNDAFGHQAGDKLLQKTAAILKKQCRSDEIVARVGGDEFVILLPKTDRDDGQRVVDRINKAVSGKKGKTEILSISIGIATKDDASKDMREVFKEAEDDMYRHKLSDSASMRSRTIDLILESLYEKNNREMHHSKRVSELCGSIASALQLSNDNINLLKLAGLMHDIGKIGIPDSILNKDGRLTNEEWDEVKRHSEVGYRILSSVTEFSEISEYVLSHHERWDGTGYPQGLQGEAIPRMSRIIALADAYDAMTSDRSYRKGLSQQEAAAEILKCAGKQFDPEIAKIFLENLPFIVK
jgi:diguanylate cyclase (GGDEF)-like protein/PAS domain S-box-containing protein/putative nucleotidyltransferase with HDIG domain